MRLYSATEQIGVHAVGTIAVEVLGWIFREQPIADMGIDAHVELVDGNPTGKLLDIQIKTGKEISTKPKTFIFTTGTMSTLTIGLITLCQLYLLHIYTRDK